MTTAELLTQLASAGATLRRLPGNRIEVVGKLTPMLRQGLKDNKGELLTLYPDPFEVIWSAAIDEAHAKLSDLWFGSADDWARLDAIEDRFFQAKAAGDTEAARQACCDYVRLCEHFNALELLHQWK